MDIPSDRPRLSYPNNIPIGQQHVPAGHRLRSPQRVSLRQRKEVHRRRRAQRHHSPQPQPHHHHHHRSSGVPSGHQPGKRRYNRTYRRSSPLKHKPKTKEDDHPPKQATAKDVPINSALFNNEGELRRWVRQAVAAGRLPADVGRGLMEYFASPEPGPRRPAGQVSHDGLQVGLKEVQEALGTDLDGARGKVLWWEKWGGKVEAAFKEMEGGALAQFAREEEEEEEEEAAAAAVPFRTVGQSDVEDGEGEGESDWEDGDDAEEGMDVQMEESGPMCAHCKQMEECMLD